MKRIALLAVVAVAGFSAAGCGSDETTSTSPPTGDELLVEYVRGGGFAPSLQRLTIEADGDATLVSGYEPDPPVRQDVELTDAELADLIDAVEAADLEAVEPGAGICADCFEYEITTARGEASLTSADLDEGGDAIVPIEVLDLMDQLGTIVEENARDTPMIGG